MACILAERPLGFPGGAVVKEPACQRRRYRRRKFDPWVRKIPWRRKRQPTPALLPGEAHGQRSLAGCSPWGRKESDTAEATWHAHRDVIKSNGKNPTEAARLSLPVWAGIQPRMSPAAGVPQRPAPRCDGDLAGRPGPSLRAELSRPAACTVREETGLQTQASVQGMLHYSVLDLKQPTQENNSITLKLDFPPKSQQPWEYLKALTKAGFRTAKHKIGGLF